jgi:DNA invertase Pin-like site-specific DNA recombinase
MEVVTTYADAGKSGVSIEGRAELKRLLADVRARALKCAVILVYDITRWGRFQDPDEAAFYEFVCKSAGYRVIYCAEPFTEDQGPLAAVLKGIKRTMAGEFSRELSVKTYAGQERLVRRGVWAGGEVGYGYRRAVFGDDGKVSRVLQSGQWKSPTERSTIVLGPDAEVEAVRRIYRMFTEERRSMLTIAAELNLKGVPSCRGGLWNTTIINRILTNERYIGHLVWAKRTQKLQTPRVSRPREQWLRVTDTLPAIVDKAQFALAQTLIRKRWQDDELLDLLKEFVKRHGKVTVDLISSSDGLPSLNTFYRRFGNIARIYALIGYVPKRPRSMDPDRSAHQRRRRRLAAEIARRLKRTTGAHVTASQCGHKVLVNDTLFLGVSVLREQKRADVNHRWMVRPFRSARPNFTVIARVERGADRILDYHVVPAKIMVGRQSGWLGSEAMFALAPYRCDTLDDLERQIGLPFVQDDLEGLDL